LISLSAFSRRGASSPWSWFVTGTSGYLMAVKEFDHGFGEITQDLESLKLALIEMTVEVSPQPRRRQ